MRERLAESRGDRHRLVVAGDQVSPEDVGAEQRERKPDAVLHRYGGFAPLCEHTFVTSDGHGYARFRRALERKNVASAWAAATELAHVSLPDALALCLLLRDREPHRYQRAAVRWLGRYCLENEVTVGEAALVAAHLATLDREATVATARSLAELLEARGRREIASALRRWTVDAAGP